jgi:hypothetical protein
MGMADARSTAILAKGGGASLRTYLRAFLGVHKRYLHLYVATGLAPNKLGQGKC